MPFRYDLHTAHRAKLYRSDDQTSGARQLQALYDSRNLELYQARLDELNSLGHQFRLTDNLIYEIFEQPDLYCSLAIQFQVKGHVITWAFMAPKDQTYQSFRDLLYTTAADAHDKVEFGCERYYRGSDSYHIKKMHTYHGEAGYNHNHYRRADGKDITPKEVAEHLRAFSAHRNGRFFFPDPAEVEHLITIFTEYYADYNYSGPDRPLSIKEQYIRDNTQQLTRDDDKEEKENIHKQEPCRTSVAGIPAHKLAEIQQMRIRGIGSEREHKQQEAVRVYTAESTQSVTLFATKQAELRTYTTLGDTYMV